MNRSAHLKNNGTSYSINTLQNRNIAEHFIASLTLVMLLVSTGCAFPALTALRDAVDQNRVPGLEPKQRVCYSWPEPSWGIIRTATVNGLTTTDADGKHHHMSAVAIQNATTKEWELVAVLQRDDQGNWQVLNIEAPSNVDK